MPSDDDNRLTAFPLHNNEPELIDYFASPLGIKQINLSRRSGIQTRQNVFEPFPEIDAVFFACRGERIQDSETLPTCFSASKEAVLSYTPSEPHGEGGIVGDFFEGK